MSLKAHYSYKIPKDIIRQPEEHEKSAAQILADYFHVDVKFVNTGLMHTADIEVKRQFWELKSPLGNGKRTIQHQFERAGKQSKRFVIDCRRSKMREKTIIKRSEKQFSIAKGAKGLIIISKKGKIVLEKYK